MVSERADATQFQDFAFEFPGVLPADMVFIQCHDPPFLQRGNFADR